MPLLSLNRVSPHRSAFHYLLLGVLEPPSLSIPLTSRLRWLTLICSTLIWILEAHNLSELTGEVLLLLLLYLLFVQLTPSWLGIFVRPHIPIFHS